EAEERGHRSERLLARDLHVRLHLGDERRLEEAPAERAALAADDDLGALADGIGEVILDLREPLRIDERADGHAGIGALADLEPLDLLADLRGEGVVDGI